MNLRREISARSFSGIALALRHYVDGGDVLSADAAVANKNRVFTMRLWRKLILKAFRTGKENKLFGPRY
jgi:hypothetical protein